MPTGKAIVHWIGCINAIKKIFIPDSERKLEKFATVSLV